MFLRNVLATLLGLFLFFAVLVLILVGIASIASRDKEATIGENSVLYLRLDQPIVERLVDDPFSEIAGAFGPARSAITLLDIKKAIQDATDNDNIQGIFLQPQAVQAGYAKIKEIRDDLVAFKESGKFILGYGEYLSEKDFYLASVANELYITPEGLIEFNGLNAQTMFFKGSLDKLEIEVQVFKVGSYKSGAEPFTNKKMSEANREQITSFVNSMYETFTRDLAESLEINPDRLRQISDSMLVRNSSTAQDLGLITSVAYYDEVLENLRDKLEVEEDEKINLVSVSKYSRYLKSVKPKISKNRVAVVVAEGEIISGKGDEYGIGSERYAKEIRKARENDRVKAIVLRINSPGGSALASDVIWREIKEASKLKPVIASMSDYAASGGYYLAMACDTIVAQPTTLTGSIGVVGILPNIKDFLDHKLGITSDVVGTGAYSDFPTASRPLTDDEKMIFQGFVDHVYEVFTTKAAEGREMNLEDLKKIAEGRVWTGQQAANIGLVDVQGNYEDAIRIAAEAAGLGEDYRVNIYPKPKNVFEQIMAELSGDFENSYLEAKFAELYPYLDRVKEIQNYSGVQARLPFDLVIN